MNNGSAAVSERHYFLPRGMRFICADFQCSVYTASNNGTDPSPVSAGHAVTRCYVARGPTALPRTSLSVFDLHFYPPLSLSVYLSSQDQRERERERERERS